jgi:hypothetical protein
MNNTEKEGFLNSLKPAYYEPSESWELVDENGQYYNSFGQELRDPGEYDRDTEGYTPFGDE